MEGINGQCMATRNGTNGRLATVPRLKVPSRCLPLLYSSIHEMGKRKDAADDRWASLPSRTAAAAWTPSARRKRSISTRSNTKPPDWQSRTGGPNERFTTLFRNMQDEPAPHDLRKFKVETPEDAEAPAGVEYPQASYSVPSLVNCDAHPWKTLPWLCLGKYPTAWTNRTNMEKAQKTRKLGLLWMSVKQ